MLARNDEMPYRRHHPRRHRARTVSTLPLFVSAMVLLTLIVALAALALTAHPAFAQGFGSDYFDRNIDDYDPCMTDYQVRSLLTRKGYTEVKLNAPMGKWYQASVARDGRGYLVIVDTCSSSIVRETALGVQ